MSRPNRTSGNRWIAFAAVSLAAATRLFAFQTTVGMLAGLGLVAAALIGFWRAADLMIWSEEPAFSGEDRREPQPPALGD
ncbi:MAG TPA: hypothetical protein VMC10_26100 [Stellaceae bacterium]|nr:hypothetical protein [Stellaceae bacterium]